MQNVPHLHGICPIVWDRNKLVHVPHIENSQKMAVTWQHSVFITLTEGSTNKGPNTIRTALTVCVLGSTVPTTTT
eukprot:2557094-Ditylum_brightwellii.AAC.1